MKVSFSPPPPPAAATTILPATRTQLLPARPALPPREPRFKLLRWPGEPLADRGHFHGGINE